MHRSLSALVISAVLGATLVAGCGGSSSSSSSTSTTTTSSSAPTPAASSSSSTPSSGGAAASSPAVQQAVAACKQSINAQPSLSADVKAKLVSICDKAANGDSAGVKKATAQVCQEIVKSTVPSQAQQQALAACPQA